MKHFLILLIYILLTTRGKGQINYSLDNDKALSVEILANLSTADVNYLDKELSLRGFKLTKTDEIKDIIGYGFVRYNVFYIRRQIKEKLIDIQTRYQSEIWDKYIKELTDFGLTLKKTDLIKNGIEYIYTNKNWYVSLIKRKTDDVTEPNDIILMIGPSSK